ncbi:MAG: transcriptional repressor [Thermanaerothrix sp.]|nr:transcriptional repressor [Thermanaerothrix sp.]
MVETTLLLDSLRKAGLRITPQRQAICELLASSHDHPTATMIYETLKPRFPSLSLATVYNTLEVLVQLGAVNVLGNAGDGMAHYDADTDPHINLACVSCHKIVDFPSQYVQFLDEEISAASGYRVLGARVLYYGLCPECQQKTSIARRESDHDHRRDNP